MKIFNLLFNWDVSFVQQFIEFLKSKFEIDLKPMQWIEHILNLESNHMRSEMLLFISKKKY